MRRRHSSYFASASDTGESRLGVAVPRAVPRLYLVEGGVETSLDLIMTADRTVKYRKKFTFAKVREFITEWSLFPFSGWSLEDGYKSHRRFFFFVSASREQADPFYLSVLNRTEKVVAAKIPIYAFVGIYHLKIENTSLLAFDRSKQKFGIFGTHASVEKFDDFLDQFIDGALDSNMTMDASLLFPSQLKRILKIAIPAATGCLVLALIVAMVLRKRAHKRE
jgi:hypothetical protein